MIAEIIVISIFVIIFGIAIWKRKKSPRKKKTKKHGGWNNIGHVVYKDKLRLVRVRDDGIAIHIPVYTQKQLDSMEREEEDEDKEPLY